MRILKHPHIKISLSTTIFFFLGVTTATWTFAVGGHQRGTNERRSQLKWWTRGKWFLSSPGSVPAVGPAETEDRAQVLCRVGAMQCTGARWKGTVLGYDPSCSCTDVSRGPEVLLGGGHGSPAGDVKFKRMNGEYMVNNNYPLVAVQLQHHGAKKKCLRSKKYLGEIISGWVSSFIIYIKSSSFYDWWVT